MANRPSNPKLSPLPLTALPQLPLKVMTTDGQQYDVAGDVWALPEERGLAPKVKIDWTLLSGVVVPDTLTPVMSGRAVDLVKLYIMERLGAVRRPIKPYSAKDYLRGMLHFARWLAKDPEWRPVDRAFDWGDLTADIFDAWVTIEYRTKRKGDAARLVRSFYLWGADSDAGHTDFSPSLASVLDAKRIKGHAQGELVESRDKRRGAFTREEMELIFNACKDGAGTEQDRAIALTLLETAIRPKQMYLLTNRDLEVIKSPTGGAVNNDKPTRTTFQLRVRKIKQRVKTHKYHFLPLTEMCAGLLLALRRPESGPEEPLFWWISKYYDAFMLRRLEFFSMAADLRSPRLPIEPPEPGGHRFELLHLTPRRFRYSIATDRIARGESPKNVAETLGHSGIEHVKDYVETSSSIADDFQRATDFAIAPIIELMEGRARSAEVNLLTDAIPLAPSRTESHEDASVYWSETAKYQHGRAHGRSSRANTSVKSVLGQDKSEVRIAELITRAQHKFPQIYPGQHFHGQSWDVGHIRQRINTSEAKIINFTTKTSTVDNHASMRPEDALPPYFADVVKSWLVISSDVSLSSNVVRVYAARHFWNFLSSRGGGKAVSFVWEELSENDMLSFEQFLLTYRTRQGGLLNPDSIRLIIQHIQRLIDFLSSSGICRQIDYVLQTPSDYSVPTRSLDEKKLIAERKLPVPGVLETLADIYHRFTTAAVGEVSDWMLIVISAVAILMLTGMRIGELVTLPYDCEVEDKIPNEQSGSDSYRYGVRYWVEKVGKKTMRIKWISPTAESVVRACVARIKQLTDEARERARILEADPTKVPLPPEIASRSVLTRPEVHTLLGRKWNTTIKTDPQRLLPQHGGRRGIYFYVADLEAYLLSRRVPHLYTVRHDDGTFQMLSESLFVIFANQPRCALTNPCRLLVEPIKASTIKSYLANKHYSFFKTYAGAEWQKQLSTNPHSFRHWLIHVAYKGGMEMHLVLRYFAKRSAGSVADYLHFSTDESNAYAPEELNAERFYVPV